MVAQRQPIDRLIDVVVGLPVVAVVAAGRSVPLIRQASRQGVRRVAAGARRRRTPEPSAGDLVGDTVGHLAADEERSDGHGGASVRDEDAATGPRGTGTRHEPPRRLGPELAVGPTLPIDDYDHLAARQVVDRIATLSAAELMQVDAYERAHRHRQTVLSRIAQLQS